MLSIIFAKKETLKKLHMEEIKLLEEYGLLKIIPGNDIDISKSLC